ncbi:MAG: TVP38/TMEM64 family protein [Gammaproteobacteria bacterium]|nr:TVP38/TMEM64 family protein [Gammaproteobacteria bacterium]
MFVVVGGALYGPVWGTLLNIAAASFGAIMSFMLARFLLRDWLEGRIQPHWVHHIEQIEQQGWKYLALIRLMPFSPFNLTNYLSGLSHLSLFRYWLVTAVCLIPAVFAYTYLGYVSREIILDGSELVQKGALAIGLVILTGYVPRILAMMGIGYSIHIHNHHS